MVLRGFSLNVTVAVKMEERISFIWRGSVRNALNQKKSKDFLCELCDTYYVQLTDHLESQIHQAFASRSDNFTSLDSIISSLPKLAVLNQVVAQKTDQECKKIVY